MNNSEILIGAVKGPGEKSNEYVFITKDNTNTKIGEFVYYNTELNQDIIGTITDKKIIRSYPESFMADPNIRPQDIASLIGCEITSSELFEVTVSIYGYFDKNLNCFINPRIAPNTGNQVFLVDNVSLSKIINSKSQGEIGSAYIGNLLTREDENVPVILNIKDLVSTHLAILASTGSGKSYTAGVLIEELMKPYNRAAVLIVDPHNEYDTLKSIETIEAFKADNYKPKIEIYPPDRVKIRISNLSEGDIKYLLPELSEKMAFYLSQAYRNVASGNSNQWNLVDLKSALIAMEEDNPEASSTLEALRWRLDSRIGNSKIFSNTKHITLDKIFAPGQCTVLQLGEIDQKEQQIIVSTLLRRINQARINTHKGLIEDIHNEFYIPYPVFILIEEAHKFAPANAPSVSINILKNILSEGRKFGVGVGLITQRPGKLDSDVLSQCMTQMIMKIINPVDQSTIAKSVESAGKELLDELTKLTRGQAIISGSAINSTVLCNVRKRITEHGGETIDAPNSWINFFDPVKTKERKMDKSFLRKEDTSEKFDNFSI